MRCLIAAGTLALALSAPAVAQDSEHGTPNHPLPAPLPYLMDSRDLPNLGLKGAVVFDQVVQRPGATWLRLYFGADVQLEPGSYIQVTSLLDGETQTLDAGTLAMWSHTSAYFNGGAVRVQLVGAPGSSSRVVIEQLAASNNPQEAGGVGTCGICGTDDRVPATDDWTGRLFPAGCTASVWNADSCLVSAGHCMGGSMVLQFNVPNSQGNCNTVNPPISDQFPVLAGYLFNNNGPGDDWAAMVSGNNNIGQTPYERYGEFRPIATAVAPVGAAASVTGFGADQTCVVAYTERTSDGMICDVDSNTYTFAVDMTFGNSGSALIRNSGDEIIGIVTHCFSGGGCPPCNIATRIDNGDFADARATLCGEEGTTTLPFFDDIPGVVLDPAKWSGVDGAEGSTRGINEPSPTRSMNLDSTDPGGDEARTGMMDATGQAGLRLTYWFEQTGTDDPPEAGDDLVIEYQNAAENWIELERHFGADPDMTNYEFVAIALPVQALHSQLRIRFRSISGQNGLVDDWFIDNVCIGQLADCPDAKQPLPCPWDCQPAPDGTVGINDLLALLAQWGAAGDCDFDGGDVGINDLLALLAQWGGCPQ